MNSRRNKSFFTLTKRIRWKKSIMDKNEENEVDTSPPPTRTSRRVKKKERRNNKNLIKRLIKAYGNGGPYPKDTTPLHTACTLGFSPYTIAWIVSRYPRQVLAKDCRLRTPLHNIIQCFCSEIISILDCLAIVDMLYEMQPRAIHTTDAESNAPVDIVESYIVSEGREVNKSGQRKGERPQNLQELSKHLRTIGVKFYLEKKRFYERIDWDWDWYGQHWRNQVFDDVSMIPLSGDDRAIDPGTTTTTCWSASSQTLPDDQHGGEER